MQNIQNINNIVDFVNNLSCLDDILIKPYIHDYDTNHVNYIIKNTKLTASSFTQKSLEYCYSCARVVVCFTLGTSHLESISMGIPTFIHLDPTLFYLRETAKELHDALVSNNILFHHPLDMSNMLNNTDIDHWWNLNIQKKSVKDLFLSIASKHLISLIFLLFNIKYGIKA